MANGVPAARVGRELLALSAGDTPALRAPLLSRRMWFYYWKAYGAPRQFDLVVAKPEGPARMRIAGSATVPASLAAAGSFDFDKTFHVALLPGNAALLTIDQFVCPDKQAFYAFTKAVFPHGRRCVCDRQSGLRQSERIGIGKIAAQSG